MPYIEVPDFENSGVPLDLNKLNQLLENIRSIWSRARYFYQRGFADGDYTTTSTSFTDIDGTNMSVTLETFGNPVKISLRGNYSSSTAAGLARLDFVVDGTPLSNDTSVGLGQFRCGSNNVTKREHLLERTIELDAGEHTFAAQWCTNAGTLTLENVSLIQFEVAEQ